MPDAPGEHDELRRLRAVDVKLDLIALGIKTTNPYEKTARKTFRAVAMMVARQYLGAIGSTDRPFGTGADAGEELSDRDGGRALGDADERREGGEDVDVRDRADPAPLRCASTGSVSAPSSVPARKMEAIRPISGARGPIDCHQTDIRRSTLT